MEETKTTWTKEETLSEAEKTHSLSALLEKEDFFKKNALRWLKGSHITKFLESLDAAEAKRLRQFAKRWFFPDKENSYGFPLLEELFKIENSREMVICLAAFEPEWIDRWSK